MKGLSTLLKKKIRIIIFCAVTIIIIIGILGIQYLGGKHDSASAINDIKKGVLSSPGFALDFKVRSENLEDKLLSVSIRIYPAQSSKSRNIILGKGSIEVLEPACLDENGREVPVTDENGLINIGPIGEDVSYAEFSYKVKVGRIINRRLQGDAYDDLLVFSGENVLLLPYFNPLSEEDMKSIDTYLSRISIQVDGNEDWNAIMPYQQIYNASQNLPVTIEKPDWNVLYNLSKSCYAFGKFETLAIQTKDGYINFFVDSACANKLNPENIIAMANIYNYYRDVFGKGLKDYAVVLLRQELDNGFAILGGVSGKTLGLSVNMESGEDWYILSHSLYHAFFDNIVQAKNLHYAPNLWLYKGLANYYVDKSAEALPDDIKEEYGIQMDGDLSQVYNRYLYFSFRDPGLLKLSPAMEMMNMTAEDEFYYNTKVPLVIDFIEKTLESRNKTKNNLIGALVERAGEKSISMGEFMLELLGQDEEKIRAYLAGDDIIPFLEPWAAKEDVIQIIEDLSQYNQMLTTLYYYEVPTYPYDPVIALNFKPVLDEAEKRKVKLSSDEIEEKIRNYSETLYCLLIQNALRADICGVEDLSEPDLFYKLNTEDNLKKWAEFINEVGIYYTSD